MEAMAQLGIDVWGIVLYLGTIALLLLVLNHILYRPLLEFMDKRRDLIKESIEESELLRKQLTDREQALRENGELLWLQDRAQIVKAENFAKESARNLLDAASKKGEGMIVEAREEALRAKNALLSGTNESLDEAVQKVIAFVLKGQEVSKGAQESVRAFVKKEING